MSSTSQNNTSSIISAIYQSRNVLLEQLGTQGYEIADYAGFSVNEVNTMKLNNQLDMLLTVKDNEQKEKGKEKGEKGESVRKTYVRFYLTKALRPANLQEMIDDLFNVEEILTKNDTLFIVVKDEVNDTLVSKIRHIWESDKIFIVIQPLKRLQYNILNHVLVPPHRIMSNQEIIKIKERYNIMTDAQFPDISRFDPVAQAIGIRPGQVCEIIRPSKTAISAPYYRICM
jgi:DNA-directed RNA polymerase subunit H (RpoH/RPB5)